MSFNSTADAAGQFHADGVPCLAGTRRTPEDFAPCCSDFAGHVDLCVSDVRYEWYAKQQLWAIAIGAEAGGGGVEIAFCPHCGTKL
jgi:hypothetical protein